MRSRFHPMLLNGAVNTEDNCGSWQKGWSKDIAEIHPEVDGLLIGRYELADHFYHGHWMHVGQPVWDRQLKLELDEAVTVLSAGGAHVALFTFPYIDPATEELNGSLYPENQPSRVDEWNRLLGQVAASHPQTVTLIDLNRILDPDGHYTTSVDGLTVRRPDDGIHLTTAGGEWLQPRLLPRSASSDYRRAPRCLESPFDSFKSSFDSLEIDGVTLVGVGAERWLLGDRRS